MRGTKKQCADKLIAGYSKRVRGDGRVFNDLNGLNFLNDLNRFSCRLIRREDYCVI